MSHADWETVLDDMCDNELQHISTHNYSDVWWRLLWFMCSFAGEVMIQMNHDVVYYAYIYTKILNPFPIYIKYLLESMV